MTGRSYYRKESSFFVDAAHFVYRAYLRFYGVLEEDLSVHLPVENDLMF